MELVIDANVVISAMISTSGRTCDLLFVDGLRLSAPEFLLVELKKHREDILEKSKLSAPEFDLALSLISSRIRLIPFSEFDRFISKAKEISPDPDDTEYLALALKLSCAVWSNDKLLKKQDLVKVINTSELLDMLNP